MGSPPGRGTGHRERMIGVLIPPAARPARPVVPLLPPLPRRPTLPVHTGPGTLLIDVASLDASGRFSARRLLRCLDWPPGHRVDAVAVAGQAVVFSASATGRQSVGVRGELAVPAAARALTGLDHDHAVVLVAAPSEQLLVVHPQQLVADLLADHYAGLATGQADDR